MGHKSNLGRVYLRSKKFAQQNYMGTYTPLRIPVNTLEVERCTKLLQYCVCWFGPTTQWIHNYNAPRIMNQYTGHSRHWLCANKKHLPSNKLLLRDSLNGELTTNHLQCTVRSNNVTNADRFLLTCYTDQHSTGLLSRNSHMVMIKTALCIILFFTLPGVVMGLVSSYRAGHRPHEPIARWCSTQWQQIPFRLIWRHSKSYWMYYGMAILFALMLVLES